MVSAGGIGGCVTVTRILVNQGRPMYNIDARSLQVIVFHNVYVLCLFMHEHWEKFIRNFVLCPTYFFIYFLTFCSIWFIFTAWNGDAVL